MSKFFKYLAAALFVILAASCTEKEVADTKLQTPYSLKVSADNVLTWSIIKGAKSYLPNINGVDCKEVTSNQLLLSDIVNGGHLVIKVKALADNSGLNEDSDWSDELVYDMAVRLPAPQPVVSGKKVTWTAIEGATGYEYDINGSIVITEDLQVDLSEYLAEKYTIKVRALPSDSKLNSVSEWSEEVTVAIFDKLATPKLTVIQPSFMSPAEASVSWDAVEGAGGYEVYVDGVKQECEGTSIDFTGKSGTFNVTVTAINPGICEPSDAAQTTITVKDYGKGTESEPYKIYTAGDWNEFVNLVNTDEGIDGYKGKYIEIAADIDFENSYVKPAGINALMSFKGSLDGKNHTLSNAKIGDGTASHQAFFYFLQGTVKNMKFDNIIVQASEPATENGGPTSAAVIVAGNFNSAFTLENCHVSNSVVSSGKSGDKYGSYAGGLVGRCNHESSLITRCSVTSTQISAITECVGGLVGLLNAGTVESTQSLGNTMTASVRNAGGIVGVAGNATIINSVSENNVISVEKTSAGGVAGACLSISAHIINVLSVGNTVKSTTHQYIPYLGLLIGGSGKTQKVADIANCIVLSGKAEYVYDKTKDETKPYAGCIGIALGYNYTKDTTVEHVVENCIVNEDLRESLDVAFLSSGYQRNAIGVKNNNPSRESQAGVQGEFTICPADKIKDGTALNQLNSWVNSNKSTYPSLKSWTADENGNPKL